MRRVLSIAIACVWLGVGAASSGCIGFEPIEGRPCPCGGGFECCENQCVAATKAATCHAGASIDAGADRPLSDAHAPGDANMDRPVVVDAPPADRPSDASDTGPVHDALPDALPDLRPGDLVGDAPPDGPTCTGDGGQAMARFLGSDFLIRSGSPSDKIYSGQFRLEPCERLLNDDGAVIYTQDQSYIPPLTVGLTILHTFDPAGPGMTSPAQQPPGKYMISSPMLSYDTATKTYTYQFHGVNFVTCPDGTTCPYIDSTNYRVVIDVVR
jgi:hypothetical protein